jgi:gluconokinase
VRGDGAPGHAAGDEAGTASAGAASDTGPLIVVMGVSGSGKTTVGRLVADRLGVGFVDGDDLHPAENVAKMRAGMPLTDGDRHPWLTRVGSTLADAPGGIVVACSALKRDYRDTIRRHAPRAVFVWLTTDPSKLAERLSRRARHFMPASLLASQLETLQPLAGDEPGIAIDVTDSPEAVADAAVAAIGRLPARRGVHRCGGARSSSGT